VIYIGLERIILQGRAWIQGYFAVREADASEVALSPEDDHLHVYVKDKAGVTTPYWKDDSDTEHEFAGASIVPPIDADYLVKTANAGLSAERVVTDSPSVIWDWATAGIVKAIRAALTGDVTAAQDSNATTIANDVVTFAKMQNINTDKLIGRDTAASGDPEEIGVEGGLEFTGAQAIRVADSGISTAKLADGAADNTKLADMAAWTIKARNNAASGDPQDVALGDITEEASPASGDFLVGFLATGEFRKFDIGNLPASGGGGGGSEVGGHVHGLTRLVADGVLTTFNLLDVAEYIDAVFDDGALVDGLDYSLSADRTQIVFGAAPGAGSKLQINYPIYSV
jgi:hypothetical protein